MHRTPAKHRTIGRSIVELGTRDPPLDLPPLSIVSSLTGPIFAPADAQSSATSNPHSGSSSGSADGEGNNGNENNNGDNGNNGGGNNDGGNSPTPTASQTSNGGNTFAPVSTPPDPASSLLTPGTLPSPSNVNVISTSGSMTSSWGSADEHIQTTTGGKNVPANTGFGSLTTTFATLGTSTPVGLVMNSWDSGSNTIGEALSPSSGIISSTSSSRKPLSGGTIAGIIVACLLLLFAFSILVVRRRSVIRRTNDRRQWWFGRHDPSGCFFLVNNSGETSIDRRSARSSFATNFDQGLVFRVDPSSDVIPELPSVAEVRERNSVLISTGGAVARRESMNSMLSNGIDRDAQYLSVSTRKNYPEPLTPMSVRPFSPSESFAFPKPPAPLSSATDPFYGTEDQGSASPRLSATLFHLSTPHRVFMTDIAEASVSTLSLQPLPHIPAVNASNDPFADLVQPEPVVIRRPYASSQDDELEVYLGDRVGILQVFDDGWAYVEKLESIEERHRRGFIPVDCLCEADQAPPTFLTQKRVSNWPDQPIAIAL